MPYVFCRAKYVCHIKLDLVTAFEKIYNENGLQHFNVQTVIFILSCFSTKYTLYNFSVQL